MDDNWQTYEYGIIFVQKNIWYVIDALEYVEYELRVPEVLPVVSSALDWPTLVYRCTRWKLATLSSNELYFCVVVYSRVLLWYCVTVMEQYTQWRRTAWTGLEIHCGLIWHLCAALAWLFSHCQLLELYQRADLLSSAWHLRFVGCVAY